MSYIQPTMVYSHYQQGKSESTNHMVYSHYQPREWQPEVVSTGMPDVIKILIANTHSPLTSTVKPTLTHQYSYANTHSRLTSTV